MEGTIAHQAVRVADVTSNACWQCDDLPPEINDTIRMNCNMSFSLCQGNVGVCRTSHNARLAAAHHESLDAYVIYTWLATIPIHRQARRMQNHFGAILLARSCMLLVGSMFQPEHAASKRSLSVSRQRRHFPFSLRPPTDAQ